MDTPWRIELFGELKAQQGEQVITRFKTQKTGAMLAYLAYHPECFHSREVLVELLWPESMPEAGLHSLSVALLSLCHQFEPPGVPSGAVLRADRFSIGVNPQAISTDVADFERAIRAAGQAWSRGERIQDLEEAMALYKGELLQGYYEEWLLPEQRRLEEAFFQALHQLIEALEQAGEAGKALGYARRGVSMDPLREEAHQEVMRLLAASGQPLLALRQYRELRRVLKEKMDALPGEATRKLAREIERSAESESKRDESVTSPSDNSHIPPPLDPNPFPIGTATFLLTDIEGSSALREPSQATSSEAIESHRRLLHQMVRRHGGHVVKEIGEGFVAAFGKASDALRCAIACQKRGCGWQER